MKRFDCAVVGEICVDLPVRPLPLSKPLTDVVLTRVDPIHPQGGGIVPNSGIAMSRLGARTAALGLIGNDIWGNLIESMFDDNRVDRSHVVRHENSGTSTTAVLGAPDGEHSFAYHSGASRLLDAATLNDHLDMFRESRFALLGYYALLPALEPDLADVLAMLSQTGCQLAMDVAGGGGTLHPLCDALPFLDYYFPSYDEAVAQTGERDHVRILATYRSFTEKTVLGLKMGADGAVLCPDGDQIIPVSPVKPPGIIVDTTGAGDCFYAGFIAALCRGLSLEESAQVGAAAGASCVTQIGAVAGIRDFDATVSLLQQDD